MSKDLDQLQGAWAITALEMDGQAIPAAMLSNARIEIAGDRFTSTGMGAVYAGTLKLDARSTPRHLDMHFDAGPEAGNVNHGIYELKARSWKLCLATRGDARPTAFATKPGSGIALQSLKRAPAVAAPAKAKATAASASSPEFAPGASADGLEGEWRMVSGVMNGVPMEDSLLQWVKRINQGDITTVMAGPQTMLKARFTTDSSASPATMDYVLLAGSHKGKTQLGLYSLKGGLLEICMGAPGGERPAEFHSVKGDGRAFTVWQKA